MNPTRIFTGGDIVTMNDDMPAAEAIAVRDGRILAVGSKDDVLKAAGKNAEIVDLEGKTLMPAFIDAHGHFANALQVVNWANVSIPPVGPVTSIPDVVAILQKHIKKFQPAKGEWIVAYGYDNSGLSEGRDIICDDLDPYFPDNPVMLIHNSNHGAIFNSAGLAIAGIDENTPTPPGGFIARKPGSNKPAGLLMETAFLPVFLNMPQPTQEELLNTFPAAQELYACKGITTVQEGATSTRDMALLRRAAKQERLYLDLVSLPLVTEIPALIHEYFPKAHNKEMTLPDAVAENFGVYHNRLKLGGVKFIFDGSPQGKTAFWSEPLLTGGPAGEENWRGQPLFPPETLNKAFLELVDKGIQTFSHCNGDAAIDMLIDAAELAGVKASDDRRDVVIHSQFMRPDQLDKYVKLGFSPSFFTVHAFFWGNVHLENLGQERAFFLSPMKSAAEKGLRFSNHNDFSVTPIDPMRMIWTAVTRQAREGNIIGPDERVDVWQALKALTINPAWQIFEEDKKGSIEVGKLADLVILNANPLTVETDAILDIQVVETFKEGETVYRRD